MDPDEGRMHLTGEFFDKDNQCEVITIDEFRHRIDADNNQQINHDHSGARVFPDQLGCTFEFKQNGSWWQLDGLDPLILPY